MGIDLDAVARSVGVSYEALGCGLTRAQADAFAERAFALTGDPAFGLRAGAVLKAERFSVLGMVMMSCHDLASALRQLVRFNRLLWGDPCQSVEEDGLFILRYVPLLPGRPYNQMKLDMELVSLTMAARKFTREEVFPAWVKIGAPAPSWADLYAEAFRCPVEFAAGEDSLAFREEDVSRRLATANPELLPTFERHAEAALSQAVDWSLSDQIRAVARGVMHEREPTIAAVAAEMRMSPRTLQRRLSIDGIRFNALVDDLRRTAAEEELAKGSVNFIELAFLLGFSDPNSFFRAFKRWTGMTPTNYRARSGTGVATHLRPREKETRRRSHADSASAIPAKVCAVLRPELRDQSSSGDSEKTGTALESANAGPKDRPGPDDGSALSGYQGDKLVGKRGGTIAAMGILRPAEGHQHAGQCLRTTGEPRQAPQRFVDERPGGPLSRRGRLGTGGRPQRGFRLGVLDDGKMDPAFLAGHGEGRKQAGGCAGAERLAARCPWLPRLRGFFDDQKATAAPGFHDRKRGGDHHDAEYSVTEAGQKVVRVAAPASRDLDRGAGNQHVEPPAAGRDMTDAPGEPGRVGTIHGLAVDQQARIARRVAQIVERIARSASDDPVTRLRKSERHG